MSSKRFKKLPEKTSDLPAEAIEKFSSFKLTEEQVQTDVAVKEIGLHTVTIVLGPDTKFDITLEVIPETK